MGKPKKKTKLPGQPKKPMSAYFLWLNEEGRELIKKETPGASVTEVAKTAGAKWGAIDETTKKKYEKMHKDLKEKYEEEYKEWFESGGKEAIKQKKKRRNQEVVVAVLKRKKVKVLEFPLEEAGLISKVKSSLRTVTLQVMLAEVAVI